MSGSTDLLHAASGQEERASQSDKPVGVFIAALNPDSQFLDYLMCVQSRWK